MILGRVGKLEEGSLAEDLKQVPLLKGDLFCVNVSCRNDSTP